MHILSLRSLVSVFLFVSISLPVSAASVGDLIKGQETSTVSRGDFLQAVADAFSVRAPTQEVTLPFQRVPTGYKSALQALHVEGALAPFSKGSSLTQPVTRGEAVQVIQLLRGLKGGAPVQFRDVPAGSALETAVRSAVGQKWIEPKSVRLFGTKSPMTVAEARLLLRKATGEVVPGDDSTPSVTTIRINLQGQKLQKYPLPKSDILETVWKLLNEEYLYDDRINPDEASYRAAEALVESLDDPYTTFMRPANAANFQTQISGEVSGIGAQVEDRDGILTVVAPLRGSPAEKAGMRPGDQILAVDGVSLAGLHFVDAVEKVRGPTGSVAVFTIRRDGVEMKLTLTRAIVRVPEIEISWQGKVAVVKLMQFGKRTDTELRGYMEEIQSQSPVGVILDLRSNPGGLLHASEVVLSNFLPKGSGVAKIKKRTEKEYTSVTEMEPTIHASVPVIVLVNGGSASASEIVAGALQDANRARIVGEKTFGKGTVQQVLQFNDNSSLKMTIAEWMTPKGRKIEGLGVTPDTIVVNADERDDQMIKALELLK